jgi:acid stress-induced BolA-like protein IbaG/YrbA
LRVPLQILSQPSDPAKTAEALRRAIVGQIPDAQVEVSAGGAGHFELRVRSASFAGESRLRQQQRVYAAIGPLLKGDAAPVHAVDRLETLPL